MARHAWGWVAIVLIVAAAGWGFGEYERSATPQVRKAPTDQAPTAPVLRIEGEVDRPQPIRRNARTGTEIG
jgi:hypothetical protein